MKARAVDELVAGLVGPGGEKAWHDLVELGPSVVPELCASLPYCESAQVRAAIVAVVAQHRRGEDALFLVSALSDPVEEVWQAAIDGLVSLSPTTVLASIRTALAHELATNGRGTRKAAFLAEAISELESPEPYGLGRSRSAHV